MLSKFMFFLEDLHCIRSFISIIALVIGIILIFIWKFKSKKTSLLICSVIAIVISCIVIVHGCYSAYLRPTDMKVMLSQQELVDFSEYLLKDNRYLNVKDFLPNNHDYFKEETELYEYEDGQAVTYNYIVKGINYQPNSAIYYRLDIYENEQDAQKAFEQNHLSELGNPISADNIDFLETSNYSVYASQSFDATFFDWHQGEHNSTYMTVVILHENYIIWISENTERHTPKLYSLIKEEKLFDSDYKLKTWVEV